MSVFLTTFVVIGLYFAFSVIIIRHEYVNYPETNRQYSCLSTICGYIFLLTLLIKIVRHPRIQTQTHSIHTEWNTTTNDDVGRKLHKICAVCVCAVFIHNKYTFGGCANASYPTKDTINELATEYICTTPHAKWHAGGCNAFAFAEE